MAAPNISVCIATYNGEAFIKAQLMSILSQLDESDEIIISDDCSKDNTLDIIKRIGDDRIRIVENPYDKGYVSNFENSLLHARGKIIFLSDQDDIWCSDKVDTCMKYLQDYDFVVSDAVIINANGKEIADSFYSLRRPYKSYWGNIWKFGYLGCCMAFKRKLLEKALPFPKNHKMCTHDNWLFLVASTYYKVKVLDEKLIRYRRHGGNVSTGWIKKTTTMFFKINYRLYLLTNIISRLLK